MASASTAWGRRADHLLKQLQRTRYGEQVAYLAAVVAVAAAYYLAAKIGLRLAYLNGAVTALWPPVGVGIAALVLFGPGLWPGIVIGDLLVGDYSTPIGTVLGQTAGNTIEVVVCAVLLRHLFGARVTLNRVVEVFGLLACAAVGTLISAAFGATSLRMGGVISRADFGEVFRTWWLSDLSGAMVIAPVLLTWAAFRPAEHGRRDLAEAAALAIALVLLAELPSQSDVPYVVFPALIWAALRFGPVGASSALLITAGLTVWNTAHNAGPFVRQSITDSLLSTQLFLATAALTGLVLAAVTAERGRAVAALRSKAERLRSEERATRELAAEQAALRRVATLVAGDAPPQAVFARVTEEVARLLGAPNASVVRYEGQTRARLVGRWPPLLEGGVPIGSVFALDSDSVVARVRRSCCPERLAAHTRAGGGTLAEHLRALGYGASVGAPVRVSGSTWGALVAAAHSADDLPPGAEQRLSDFADLIAQALANADAYERLAASRKRIVEAGDEERRRLERNLHDGAQQRLVALALRLQLIGRRAEADPAAARQELSLASDDLAAALDELRELARGIHPAVLTDRGLSVAVSALADRCPVPMEITAMPDDRLPPAVEAAAYYTVAEAITNVTKYARASYVTVAVRVSGDLLQVDVGDDGVGGADPSAGTGLRGIADRVEALQGRLRVTSPPGRGTSLRAVIPLPRDRPAPA